MKKLGKSNTSEANTIQAYSCTCSCSCALCVNNRDLTLGITATMNLGTNVKTISALN